MTELYIDGVSVVLGKDFSVQVKRENPLFNKNGEYTYDITLPLDNAVNASLYKHLNRLNITGAISLDRKAVLMADNRVYCNGTEIITGWTDDTVSIQVASGNSELNWLAGSDKLISELEFSPAEIHKETTYLNLIEYAYPQYDFCYPEVCISDTEKVINLCTWEPTLVDFTVINAITNRPCLPQPYLCAVVRKVLNALGYELVRNQLEETDYKYLYIINPRGRKWTDVLEGWKVIDFLEQVEKMFNATIVVDNRGKKASLLLNASFFAGGKTQHVRWAEDVYEAEIEEGSELTDYSSICVGYAFPDTDYWKQNCLDKTYLEQAEPVKIPEDYQPETSMYARISNFFSDNKELSSNDLIEDTKNGCYALLASRPESGGSVWNNFYLLDRFAPVNRNEEDSLELEIVPAMLVEKSIDIKINKGEQYEVFRTFYWRACIEEEEDDSSEEEEPETEIDKIRTWEEPDEPSAAKLYMAFYPGPRRHDFHSGLAGATLKAKFPESRIDTYPVSMQPVTGLVAPYTDMVASLRPAELAKVFWNGAYDISYDKAVKLTSFDPNVYDPAGIFEIRNRRYICREIEYTLGTHGRKGAWTGTFYPIRLSDTEADARWILNDGKWRDGGVWLDNGRWLDE